MSEELHTDGTPVEVEGVTLSTPGLGGRVEVHLPGSAGVRGADDATAALVDALTATGVQEQLTIEILDPFTEPGYEVGAGPATDRGEPGFAVEVPGPGSGMGQVLLAKDEGGALRWIVSVDEAGPARTDRGGESRRYVVPRAVVSQQAGGQRGLFGAIGKKLLKVFAFPLLEAAARATANHFATQWEERSHPHRLRPFEPGSYGDPLEGFPGLTASELDRFTAGPTLLFVHGTMSLSHSGFGRFPADLLTRLHHAYEGRVLAFDHPTVSIDPTGNASWLAAHLPDPLTLDVLAHSRGGLVAREIVERPEAAGFAANTPEVRRLMMVATPNSGTALADPTRLGSLVDRVTNLLDLIPDNAVTDVISILISVVKQVAVGAFNGLDGLTCMTPESKYLVGLAAAGATGSATRYVAVASDYEPPAGAPLARVARDGAIDIVFGSTENDLIVPTEGVYSQEGAAMFPVTDRLVYPTSASVDHSAYWESDRFRQIVLDEFVS